MQNLVNKLLMDWAVFLKPNGICRNSKSPKGVAMAVLGKSSVATGIWW